MADTGVKYPTAVATTKETGDDNDWVNPTNVGAADTAYAYITAATFDNPDVSYLMSTTGYNMGVTAGATIDGIKVEINRYYANGRCNDVEISLTKAGGTSRAGSNASTTAIFASSLAVVTFGSATSLWGTTWTADEVNASTFGVLYKMGATDADADGFVDFIRTTAYYTAGATTYQLNCTDGIKMDQTIATSAKFGMGITDGIKGSDSFGEKVTFQTLLTEGFLLVDSVTLEISVAGTTYEMVLADDFKISDSFTQKLIMGMSLTDGLKGGDSPIGKISFQQVISDGFKTGDTPTFKTILQVVLADGTKLGDTPGTRVTLQNLISDGIKLDDTATLNSILQMLLSDGLTLSDVITLSIPSGETYELVLEDGFKLSDFVSIDVGKIVRMSPAVGRRYVTRRTYRG